MRGLAYAATIRDYVCPSCRSPLNAEIERLSCECCGLNYPVANGIPDFIQEDLSTSTHPILRSTHWIDRLARIYETRLWYPIVYHLYGGLFIPSVSQEAKMVTDMVDSENGLGLDVACGTGLFTRSIARRMRFVHGVDISIGMVRKAIEYAEDKKLQNIRFARARAERLPFRDSTFDGVICCGALHLFPDTRQALMEMGRVAKKSARLAVMTFVRRRLFKFKRVYEHLLKDHGVRVFDVEELDECLSSSGFKNFHYNVFGSLILFSAEKL